MSLILSLLPLPHLSITPLCCSQAREKKVSYEIKLSPDLLPSMSIYVDSQKMSQVCLPPRSFIMPCVSNNLLLSPPSLSSLNSQLLWKVLRNLTSNALKFTPTMGNVTVSVETKLLPPLSPFSAVEDSSSTNFDRHRICVDGMDLMCTHELCIHVVDTGVGIAQVSGMGCLGGRGTGG